MGADRKEEGGVTWRLEPGDCLDPAAGMIGLGDGAVDCTITDPPYESEAHTQQCRVKRAGGIMKLDPLAFSPMTPSIRSAVSAHIARVTRRWALIFCQIEASQKWVTALSDHGMIYRRSCIWVKPDGMPQYSGDRPGMGYETIVVMHAPGRSHWNGGGRTGVFVHNKNEPVRSGHPTQKPISLMRELVELFTDEGETVLDPFTGSGTTGLACLSLARSFIGWERSREYYELARSRLSGEGVPVPGQLSLLNK